MTKENYPDCPLFFWRTSTGREVDFILGEKDLAIEIKSSNKIRFKDISSLLALIEDGPVKKACLVCLESEPRFIHKYVEVIPWKIFLDRLWNNDLF